MDRHHAYLGVLAAAFIWAGYGQGATAFQDMACHADSDCVAVKGPCGEWAAVHKDRKEALEKHYAETARFIECMPPQNEGMIPKTSCKDKACSVTLEKDPEAFRHPPGILNKALPEKFPYVPSENK